MRLTIPLTVMVLAGAGLLAATLIVSLAMAPLLALVVPVGLFVGVAVVLHPFLGLFLVVFFSQLDALAAVLFQEFPVSGVKILTFLTLSGVLVSSYREPRRERLGPDELALRLAVMFGVVVLISLPFAGDIELGLVSTQRLLSLLLLFYLTILLARTPWQIEILMLAIVTATLISSPIVMWDSLAVTMASFRSFRSQGSRSSPSSPCQGCS